MEKDRISDLPDDALLRILSFISTKQAVATSVLAKRWRYLWHSLTTFELFLRCRRGSVNDCEENYLRFSQSVYDVLNAGDLHRPIERFRFGCSSCYLNDNDFNTWINTAIQRRVEHLDVSLESMSSWPSYPPIFLPNCRTLVHLKLTSVLLKLPTSVDFPSLKTMNLYGVTFQECGNLADLLSGSQLLEDLKLTNLQFCFSNVRPFRSLPKLVKVSIDSAPVPFEAVINAKFLRIKWMDWARASYEQMDFFLIDMKKWISFPI